MMKRNNPKLSLTRPATYQIKVPGHLEASWIDCVGKITLTIDHEGDGSPVTILTGMLDQAALHGLLCQLYSLGLPLISLNCMESDSEDEKEA